MSSSFKSVVGSRSFSQRRSPALIFTALATVLALTGCKESDDDGLGLDEDGDGGPAQLDCDDTDSTVFPSADDVPGDGIDRDCSGSDGPERLGGAGGESSTCKGSDCDPEASSGGEPATGGSRTSGTGPLRGEDADGDGFAASPKGDDCDDDRLDVYSDAPEVPLTGTVWVQRDSAGVRFE